MGQHKNPQEYLRHFGIPPDRREIWQFDTQNSEFNHRPVPIKNAAQARNYYSADDERMLAEDIEAPAHRPLNKLRNGEPLIPDDRSNIAWYINAMVRRGPRARNHALEMLPTEFQTYRDRLIENLDQMIQTYGFARADWLKALDQLGDLISRGEVSDRDDMVRSQHLVGLVALSVFHMQWVVVHSNQNGEFITNDNPVFFTEGIGLSHPLAELSVPLSPDTALHASWRGLEFGLIHIDATQNQLIKEINRRTVQIADRMLFSRRRFDWLAVVAAKRPNVPLKPWHFGLPGFQPVTIPQSDTYGEVIRAQLRKARSISGE